MFFWNELLYQREERIRSSNGHRIIQVSARYLWYVRINDRLSLISSSPKPLTASPLFNNGNYFMPISSRPIFIFRRHNLLDSSSNNSYVIRYLRIIFYELLQDPSFRPYSANFEDRIIFHLEFNQSKLIQTFKLDRWNDLFKVDPNSISQSLWKSNFNFRSEHNQSKSN